ncbi:MAG: TolC family protein [Deltaproteobacteria bacterium]|nr:TolC family protein [Deltaproteobacteria bacterium]
MLAVLALSLAASSSSPLTLEDAWTEARARSTRLRVADADVADADADVDVAGRWLPDPQLQLSGSTDALTTSEGENNVEAEVQQALRWPMETWARESGTRALARAAQQDRALTEVVAWRALTDAYVELVAAVDVLTVRRSLFDVASRVNAAAEQRAIAGESAAIEASFAAVDVAAAESALAAAESALAAARARLCTELGDLACPERAVAWPSLVVGPAADDDVAAAVELRADVQAAVERVAAARLLRDAAGWERVPAPTIGVVAVAERSELDASEGKIVDDDTLLGLRLSIPLPLFSLAQGSVPAANAEQARREAELEGLRRQAFLATRASIVGWQAAVRARTSWEKVEPRFEEALRWLAEGYVAGVVDLNTQLAGRDRIARARVDAINARRAEAIAAADVFAALGRLPPGMSAGMSAGAR